MPELVPVARIPRGRRKPNPEAVPTWARILTTQVCAEHGVNEPPVRWRRSSRNLFSAGRANTERISITAGSAGRDQRVVLLHELGHWLTPKDGHTYRFWATAWDLFETYMPDELDYIALRESLYRKKATDAMPIDRLALETVEVCALIRNGIRVTAEGAEEWRKVLRTIANMDGKIASRDVLSAAHRLSV